MSFWLLLTGIAVWGLPLAILGGDVGATLVALLLLGVCCLHWRRDGPLMGKGRRIRREKEMRDFHRRATEEKGLPVDPEGTMVEIPASLQGVAEEVRTSLEEFKKRGCTCNPEVVAKPGGRLEGKVVLHTMFLHEDWCPFLRMISQGKR